jgi:hypothetical protein
MPSAACALASVRKFAFFLPFNFRPEASREIVQALQDRGIIELPKASFVLGGQPRLRHRHLAGEPRQFGKFVGFQLHPLASDLDMSLGKVAIKGILAPLDSLVPPTQDSLEVFN